MVLCLVCCLVVTLCLVCVVWFGYFGGLGGGGWLLVCCVLCFRWCINSIVVFGIAFAWGV